MKISAHDSDPLPGLVAGLLPDSIELGCFGLTATVDNLYPAEAELVASAVAQRQSEFATGRARAREILDRLGFPNHVLLRDADRVPIWPAGVRGSISHTAGCCIVAATKDSRWAGVGVDVEPDAPTKMGIERRVCTSAESKWIASQGADDASRWIRLFFSAKEAVYKAFFPTVRAFWGFHDVELVVDPEAGTFHARLPEGAGRSGVEGVFRRHAGFCVTAVPVPSAEV